MEEFQLEPEEVKRPEQPQPAVGSFNSQAPIKKPNAGLGMAAKAPEPMASAFGAAPKKESQPLGGAFGAPKAPGIPKSAAGGIFGSALGSGIANSAKKPSEPEPLHDLKASSNNSKPA